MAAHEPRDNEEPEEPRPRVFHMSTHVGLAMRELIRSDELRALLGVPQGVGKLWSMIVCRSAVTHLRSTRVASTA